MRASVHLSAATLMVTLANLGRDVAIAAVYGTSLTADAFYLALAVPVFLATVAIGSFRNAVVPVLEKVEQAHGATVLRNVVGGFFLGNSLVTVSVGALVALTAPLYVRFLGARLPVGGVHLLTYISWAVLPMMLLSVLAALNDGPLHVRGRFFVPTLSRVTLPFGIASGALLLQGEFGIYGACIGGAVGASIQLCLSGFLLKMEDLLGTCTMTDSLRVRAEVKSQFFMLAAGTSIVYVSPIINQWMASFLGTGAVATLGYANRLAVGVSSLTTGALAPALLLHFSRQVSKRDVASLNDSYVIFLKIAIWTGCALAIFVNAISYPAVELLYERGQFCQSDTIAVAGVLSFYALQFPPLLVSAAAFTLISALGKNKIFIPLSAANAIINVAGNAVFMKLFGINGIAISTALTYCVSLLAMNVVLARGGFIRIPRDVLLHGLSAVVVAIVIVAVCHLVVASQRLDSGCIAGAYYIAGLAVFCVLASVAIRAELKSLLRPYRS